MLWKAAISQIHSPLIGAHTKVTCIVDRGGNPLGCILWLLLAVVSFGLAIVLWFLWDMERDDFLPQVVVTAYPDSRGVSTVAVTSRKKPEYAGPVAGWIRRELVESRRAATADTRDLSASVDPTEQIRKLARLRDSGTITEEEFERKKTDLLDRM